MNQLKTPLYTVLKEHDEKNPISLHVPGHKYGQVYPVDDDDFFRQILKIDATELTQLDDLHSPEGAILEAETLLAQAYDVKKSFFLVNGSTVGNLAMIMGTVKEGEPVLVQRNCHKSVLNGIQLARGTPVLLGPEINEDWGVAGGVSLETIKEAYKLYPNCKAVVLTYPNYYGLVSDLESIIEFAHDRHIPVLVDEAHGTHFIGGDYFPPSAVELGADVVVQSAHKTLPAMTMGSFLHINSNYVSIESIETYLRILQSSSPSYPIMASLDLARSYIATFNKGDQKYVRERIILFKEKLKKIDGIRVLEYPNGIGDPLKITIQSTSQLSGYDLQSLFEKKGIFSELADPYNVLFILPLLKEDMSFPFEALLEGIWNALHEVKLDPPKEVEKSYFHKSKISTLHINENQELTEKAVSLQKSINEICAETIIPYPPGVPFLLRGEKITEEDIMGLLLLKESGARFQGGRTLSNGQIKVFVKR